MKTRKPTGFVFYRGPSLIDGSPIIGIAITGKSTNRKTGNLVQTYILRADMSPMSALMSGADVAICGACPHRPYLATIGEGDGACYVNVGQGAMSVYNALLRGNYPDDIDAAANACAGRIVRLGTYGDPMAIPVQAWRTLMAQAIGNTGYSHQWLEPQYDDGQRDGIMSLCMASADDETQADMARALGYRYFRIRRPGDALAPREFACPASEEAGKRRTCATCQACDGTSRAGAASPVIIAHGSKKNRIIRIAAAA